MDEEAEYKWMGRKEMARESKIIESGRTEKEEWKGWRTRQEKKHGKGKERGERKKRCKYGRGVEGIGKSKYR